VGGHTGSRGSGDFFDSFAREFDTFYDGKRNLFMRWIDHQFRSDMFARFDKTFELLGDLAGRSILDVGCGSGPYMEEAIRRGATRVTGIDPARAMLDLAERRIAAHRTNLQVTLVEGYFPRVSAETSHDVGIVMGVMDYVENASDFLVHLRHSVNVGAAVSFPSVHWFRSPVRRVRYRLRRCPLFLYEEVDIRALMDVSGISHYQIHKIPGAGMDFVVWIQR
jgi:cyclopropane fatty-acyl-phospholipid synthase-like methyltransferase